MTIALQPYYAPYLYVMLSICIPVYKTEVSELVHELLKQGSRLEQPIEILIGDDACGTWHKEEYEEIGQLENVRLIEHSENLGRSANRNELARLSRYPYLLFVDGDAQIPNRDFLLSYLKCIEASTVVYGGCSYPSSPPQDPALTLRWLYGRQRESRTARERNKEPYASFSTFNFLIPRRIFSSIRLDTALIGYGHEDTLFGHSLKDKGVNILHIDNPAIHLGLEPSGSFLDKTDQGILNLHRIYLRLSHDRSFVASSKLLSIYHKLRKIGLRAPLSLLGRAITEALRYNLLGPNPSLFVFDLYKLLLLCRHPA